MSSIPLPVTPQVIHVHSMFSPFKVGLLKVHENAQMPTQAHPGDAGFDLYAVTETTIEPGSVEVVRTGLQLASCPLSFNGNAVFLDVRSRSGLARKSVFTVTGTVDVGYRGEIGVVLLNAGKTPYTIMPGDRIAQLVIQLILTNTSDYTVAFVEATDADMSSSTRGTSGYGSTGK